MVGGKEDGEGVLEEQSSESLCMGSQSSYIVAWYCQNGTIVESKLWHGRTCLDHNQAIEGYAPHERIGMCSLRLDIVLLLWLESVEMVYVADAWFYGCSPCRTGGFDVLCPSSLPKIRLSSELHFDRKIYQLGSKSLGDDSFIEDE